MLERTAGCLENAGRRFFQDSNTTIRSRASLHSRVGQYNNVAPECSQWRFTLRQGFQQVSGNAANSTTSGDSTELRTPFLEFLYPSQTQEFAAICLLRSSKRIAPRRRRRAEPVVSRRFASQFSDTTVSTDITPEPSEQYWIEYAKMRDAQKSRGSTETQRDRLEAKGSLTKLLEAGDLEDTERAWELYMAAKHPGDMNSALLAALCSSEHPTDHRRAKRLFLTLEEYPSGEDYLHLAKSYLAVGQPTEMDRVCREALDKSRGFPCLAFTLAYYLDNAQWESAREIWNLKPTINEIELWESMVPYLPVSSLPKSLLDQPFLPEGVARDMARFVLDNIVTSAKAMEDTPVETLLLLIQKYSSMGILTPKHCFHIIETLQSSDIRSIFVRSIVIYRNFRWLMPGKVPPAKLLGGFLRQLATFEITAGVRYFLNEFSHFYVKPTVDAYKNALIAFARAGDVRSVNLIFKGFVSDHGKPQSRRLLTPLLYVHARLGNVQETMAQFKRISEEFGYQQNIVCWNILLTAYANADDISGCFMQFKRMIKENMQPTSHTFGIVMGLCASKGDVETIRQLLALAKQRHVKITTPLLDTVVEAYCNNKNFEMAERVADTCLDLDVKGSRVRMFNVLLWNHAFRMDLDSISRIRSRMDAAGIQPDDMTYAALMLSLVLLGQTDSARRILRELHRSRRIHATEFHYAIILYGYVKARNRDMVHVIFREITTRFNKPGLTSRLLALRTQVQRDLQLLEDDTRDTDTASLRLENAEKFLSETIAEFNPSKFGTKQPMPGASGLPLTEAFPAMYYESVIAAYGKRGAFDEVQKLFEEYTKQQPLAPSENGHDIAPIRLLAALMLAYLKTDQHKKVEECWKMAFPRAQNIASRLNDDVWLSSQLASPLPVVEPSQRSVLTSLSIDGDCLSGSEVGESSSKQSPILPAYRFMLSRPLSLYMRSLAYRNEYNKVLRIVPEVEKAGFTLTTFNWSTIVQMLASSDQLPDQLEAFAIFEKKFMPNFPGWKNLRRGYGMKPSGVPSAIDQIERPSRGKRPDILGREGRRYWSKVNPEFMQPTYVSMVYLASALLRVRERSISSGGSELLNLHLAAPKTVEAIGDMPYLREKFQGVLLRRRQERGDSKDHLAERGYFVWTGGILGVGGRRRASQDRQLLDQPVEPETSSAEHSPLPGSESEPSHMLPEANAVDDLPAREDQVSPYKTLDYQDEFDLEAETALSLRQKLLGIAEEELDDDHLDVIDAEYEEPEQEEDGGQEEEGQQEEEPQSLADESAKELNQREDKA
ncbi:hypothetical protein ARAM_002487 [Aspergillus rambellii]|uniref:Translation regulator (Cya5) n=1 Tax=Aspergillus rambellii TaxID=308745 RepID=A0A0F8WHC1_9EURO|nr:hypothetical protein ARAM_002487 [Aspergillus rambellii]